MTSNPKERLALPARFAAFVLVGGSCLAANTLVLWALTVVFSPVAGMGHLYLLSAIVLGAVFTGLALQLVRNATPAAAMRLFTYSITYITLLFGAIAVDQLLRSGL